MGGFESACHINLAGQRLDMICATQHDTRAGQDYLALRALGIGTVREGLRWHLVDRGAGRYDFSSVAPIAEAARHARMQVVWNLCHYAWPDDIGLFSPAFVDRFAAYAREAARYVAGISDDVPVYSPINEISFFAWAAGEVGYIYPHARGAGRRVKEQLVRAAIAGMEAIRDVDPRARFIHDDPLIHVVTPKRRPDLARAAADQRAAQFEGWDMLAGGLLPEIGGHPRYLDIVGVNFYHTNQWEYPDRTIAWDGEPRDPRWKPLGDLVTEVFERYDRPVMVSETSHFGSGRARWLREVSVEADRLLQRGVPLLGVCLYPIIDRPDWDNPDHWHRSGLWDLVPEPSGGLERVLCADYAAELERLIAR
jgi:hypothetical protein